MLNVGLAVVSAHTCDELAATSAFFVIFFVFVLLEKCSVMYTSEQKMIWNFDGVSGLL